MSLDQRAEELASDLGVDHEEVKHDLENLVAYRVPMDEAIQSLRRKYDGGDERDPGSATEKRIDEITPADSSVSITAMVLTKGKRTIRYQGEDVVITEGTLADESGRIDYTAWEPVTFEPGETISIANASVREWNDRPEINIGEQTRLSEASTGLSVPYPVGGERTLDDVRPGDRGVTVSVRVLEVERKRIDGRDGETEILSGVLGDGTARLPFTDWDPRDGIEEDESLRMENVYVREFRGVPSINLSEFTDVTPADSPIDVSERARRMSIGKAVAGGGRFDVELVGTVVAVRDGSGLIQRCPECNRVIQRGECRSHGEVDGIDDLRVKAILDDGTGTATAVLGTEIAAECYGGDVSTARERAREAMDQTVVADAIRDDIVGRPYRVRGAVRVDDFGATVEARAFDPMTEPPADRARALLDGVSE